MPKGLDDQVVWLSESTENRYSSIVESRHLVVFPWLVESVLARIPSTVLDYGAGDGEFLLRLREKFVGELKSQFRILKPGGCALVAVTHPCFREENYSSFYSNFSNYFYLRSGFPFQVSIFDENAEVKVLDYHWNLSTMLHQASEAGFRLVSLSELPDTDKGSGRGAPWICFEFGKD